MFKALHWPKGEKFRTLDLAIISQMTPKAQASESQLDKWDYIKLRNYCATKGAISRMKTINS